MKKPKYTRNPVFPSKVCAPRHTFEDRVDTTLRIIYYYESSRNHSIELLKGAKNLKHKDVNSLLIIKRDANKIIKREKNILKSIQNKRRCEPKIPTDIFQCERLGWDADSIEAVRNSPTIIKYLQDAKADYENSPFKGMFTWFAFLDRYDSSMIWVTVITLRIPGHFHLINKVKAYNNIFTRLINKYGSRYFKVGV